MRRVYPARREAYGMASLGSPNRSLRVYFVYFLVMQDGVSLCLICFLH
jgi:hypothetical protein